MYEFYTILFLIVGIFYGFKICPKCKDIDDAVGRIISIICVLGLVVTNLLTK